jgi:iron uptake system EfeUOB component EfeO/EfeM
VFAELTARRLLAPVGIALLSCVVAFALFTALGVGVGNGANAAGTAVHGAAPRAIGPLQAYSEADAKRNGAAGVGGAPPVTQLAPLPAAAFAGPIARYKRYSAGQLRIVLEHLAALEGALRTGRLARARTAWRGAYASWLHLGAVYGAFGDLTQAIDGSPGVLAGGVSDPRFTGLHRLERDLWRGAPAGEELSATRRLRGDVRLLLKRLPGVQITPLQYATRAHEILEDAARDLLSGTDVPWSDEGVLATAAGLRATREVIETLRSLLDGREGTIETVDFNLDRLASALASIRREHGGGWPAVDRLSLRENELLDGTLGAALEALDGVPGTLETKVPPTIPSLPNPSR